MNTTPKLPARPRAPQLLCTLVGLAALLLAASPVATAVPPALNIAQKPLFLGGTDPNVMFILDASGSMFWSFMPDSISKNSLSIPGTNSSACLVDTATTKVVPKRLTSSSFNGMYYDPAITYLPPMRADGSSYTASSFSAAVPDGFVASGATMKTYATRNYYTPTRTVVTQQGFINTAADLSTGYRAIWGDGAQNGAYESNLPGQKCLFLDGGGVPAYYNQRKTTGTCPTDTTPADTCFDTKTVSATSGVSRERQEISGALSTDERTNFANWYSFYRSRMQTAKSGVSRAFAQAGAGMYMGYGVLNSSNTTIDGVTSNTLVRGVRPFKDYAGATDPFPSGTTYRSDFFNWLFAKPAASGTPLREALNYAGLYYETSAAAYSSKPWAPTTGNAVSCRQSYTILMTDGYWNGGAASTADAKNDTDSTDGGLDSTDGKTSFAYKARAPFKDNAASRPADGSLADVAMHYWKRDLRTSLTDNVPVGTTSIDKAFWQHMTTFTIGLGLAGTVNSTDAFDAINATTPTYPATWPVPASDSENNLDDLLHAGVNGHGGFYSAKNPAEFANALSGTLSAIAARQVSAAAAAVNSGTLSADSMLYQATFNSNKWSGDVVGYKIDPNTQALTEIAKASDGVPSPAGRKIYTWRPSYSTIPAAGVPFLEANLSPTQTAAITTGITGASLGSTTVGDIVNYVRGDRSKEISNSGTLRNRDSVIGDIINSDPSYARKMNLGYKYALGLSAAARSSYDAFVAAQIPTLYVGANDGMLHAFNGSKAANDALDELFAFIPNSVIGNLPYLAKSTDFAHKYFVDGPTTVSHAYLNGRWKTILVGATGAGAKAYFAIDVTTPSSPVVMWEFSDADNAVMGNTMGKAAVVHLANGKWAAVFGNGYNSTAQTASLFVLDLENGALIKKLDVTSRDTTLANGLSAPAVSDLDGDGNGDLVYAGDLQGNLWKFNLSDSNPNNWAVSFGGKPLFQTPITTDGTGTHRQAITIKPELARHPQGGSLIMFGTGKFFESGDQSNVDMQTFYGIRDECGFNTGTGCTTGVSTAKVTLSELLQQTFTGSTVRILSKNTDATKKGYYINLRLGTANTGERVISNMLLLDDRIIFTSVIPNEDVCGFGGNSWLWELNLLTGGETPYSVFDLNNDGKFDASDQGNAVTLSGLARTPALVRDGSTGHLNTNDNKPVKTNLYGEFGRQTWRKVR